MKYTIDKAHERERTKKIKQMYANQQKISDKRMLKHFKEELEKVQNDLEYFERDYYIKSYKNAIKELKNKLLDEEKTSSQKWLELVRNNEETIRDFFESAFRSSAGTREESFEEVVMLHRDGNVFTVTSAQGSINANKEVITLGRFKWFDVYNNIESGEYEGYATSDEVVEAYVNDYIHDEVDYKFDTLIRQLEDSITYEYESKRK